jgi:hypothetical protein
MFYYKDKDKTIANLNYYKIKYKAIPAKNAEICNIKLNNNL